MVEFGAGGTIVQQEEEAPPPPSMPMPMTPNLSDAPAAAEEAEETAPAAAGESTTPAMTPAPVTPATPAATTQRRKRKAKGWFCPVCRQRAYSLLLFLTQS